MTGPRLISAAEAARRLGVNKSTMTRWIAAGKVPAFRTPGGHWRINASWFDKLYGRGCGYSTLDNGATEGVRVDANLRGR